MGSLSSVIRASMDEWDDPVVERAVFGTDEADAIARVITRVCVEHLGDAPRSCLFYQASVGCVAGIELTRGERVVVKLHQPDRTEARLAACQAAQASLAATGFPCPIPVLAPTRVAGTLATVERWLAPGERRDPRVPGVRRELASGLQRIAACEDPAVLASLGGAWFSALPPERTWPKPHNALFDFERTGAGAEWIDALAVRARSTPLSGKRVLGHFDWRIEHVGFDGDRLCSSYDYDSLHVEHEPVLVGAAAHAFTAEWDRDVPAPAPTLADIRAFVADYEAARGERFAPDERRLVAASCVYSLAYTARCQHAFGADAERPPGARFAPVLREAAKLLDADPTSW